MASVEPGEEKYEDSDRITQTSENGAGEQGNALAYGSGGGMVLTSGDNGFAGIQGSTPNGAGDSIAVQKHGITPATVAAGVAAGNRLVPGADGVLQTTDEDASGTADPAGPGDIRAESDEDGGIAEVYVP